MAAAFGLELRLLPATDDRLRTIMETPAGAFTFQEWFVARGHRDEVDGLRFEGAETARPAPGVLEALNGADVILVTDGIDGDVNAQETAIAEGHVIGARLWTVAIECDIPDKSPLRAKAAHYIRLGRSDLTDKSVTLLAGAA